MQYIPICIVLLKKISYHTHIHQLVKKEKNTRTAPHKNRINTEGFGGNVFIVLLSYNIGISF